MDIIVHIKDSVNKISNGVSSKVYLAPEIPEKKLNNAIKHIAKDQESRNIVACIDITVFGSCKDGLVFFGNMVYIKPFLEASLSIMYSDIKDIKYTETEEINEKGKSITKKNFTIFLKNDVIELNESLFNDINGYELEKFFEFICESNNTTNGELELYSNEDQLKPLEMMDEDIKLNYAKILCNYAYSEDNIIDSKEYAKILDFIVRINISSESRLFLRAYMTDISTIEDTEEIIIELSNLTNSSELLIVKQSLMKDILYLFKLKNEAICYEADDEIMKLASVLNVSGEQLDVMKDAIKREEDVIKKRFSDTQIQSSIKELSSTAVAVGVPMAALYFSGTAGVSAIGMTSGLATLGFSAFGLSSMFTGVGMIALIGVGTFHGMKKITGVKELENNKQREKLLQEIIINSQKSLNVIIEDVNMISLQLNKALNQSQENELKIRKLSKLLSVMSTGANIKTSEINKAEIEKILTKLPKDLNINRLEELTKEPTFKQAKEFILKCYSKEDLALNGLNNVRELYRIMEHIGYLDLKNASIASAKSGLKSTMKKFTGMNTSNDEDEMDVNDNE